jgi:hypothetical protein
MEKPEKKETKQDEQKETPAKQKKEAKEGTESHGNVSIPEAFQTQASALVSSCESDECLSFLQSLVYKRQDDLRSKKMGSQKKGKISVPSEYSLTEKPE